MSGRGPAVNAIGCQASNKLRQLPDYFLFFWVGVCIIAAAFCGRRSTSVEPDAAFLLFRDDRDVSELHRISQSIKFEVLSSCLDGKLIHFTDASPVQKGASNTSSAADVKMEIPVLERSLKSSILRPTCLQMDKNIWGVGSVTVEQSRRKANMVTQGDGKFRP